MADRHEPQDKDSQRKPSGESPAGTASPEPEPARTRPVEIGGRKGPDPTRYGDWEKGGRCIDF